jgi:hypothetical protein
MDQARYDAICEELKRLSGELWDLVNPQAEERAALMEMHADDYGCEAAEMMVTDTKDAWVIAINTALDVMDYRENIAEVEAEDERLRQEQEVGNELPNS